MEWSSGAVEWRRAERVRELAAQGEGELPNWPGAGRTIPSADSPHLLPHLLTMGHTGTRYEAHVAARHTVPVRNEAHGTNSYVGTHATVHTPPNHYYVRTLK